MSGSMLHPMIRAQVPSVLMTRDPVSASTRRQQKQQLQLQQQQYLQHLMMISRASEAGAEAGGRRRSANVVIHAAAASSAHHVNNPKQNERPQQQENQTSTATVLWRVTIDPKSKRPYYYHPITRETTWKKPQELIDQEKKERAHFFSIMEKNIRSKLLGNSHVGTRRDKTRVSSSSSVDTSCSSTDENEMDTIPVNDKEHKNCDEDDDMSSNNQDEPEKEPSSSTGDTIEQSASKPTRLFRTLSSYDNSITLSCDIKRRGKFYSIPSPVREDYVKQNATTTASAASSVFTSVHQQKTKEDHSTIPLRRRSNSTSTIFVRMGTMNAPDQDATIQCVATVLRAHLIEAVQNPIQVEPHFHVFMASCKSFQMTMGIPSLQDISSFMQHVFARAQMESECIIMSLIYVERFLKATAGRLQLQPSNWRSILFCSMVMSSKVWDDLSMCNADFSKIWPELSLKQINELELAYLEAVEYNVRVSAVSYAKYYFHLRSLCASMGMVKSFDENTPLNLDSARKMQVISEEYEERSKLKPVMRRRSLTITSTTDNRAQSPEYTETKCSASLEQLVHMHTRTAGGASMTMSNMRRALSKN